MLPSATNFLNPCLCDSAAFLHGAGVAEWLFANDFRAGMNFLQALFASVKPVIFG
jgi:hypothetical protein